MVSTQKNITNAIPQTNASATTGKFLRYPAGTGKRLSEGGLRLQQIYKISRPECPLVTVITVCLNSSKTIEQCIESVLQQTYENIEYIIIDGGSTDDTLNILGNYSNSIDYYISEPDRGLYHAMNKGLELASGEYILFLNSDDWYEQDCIHTLVMAREFSGCDFVGALANYVDEKAKRSHLFRSMPYNSSCLLRMPLRHETLLISSKIYNKVGLYNEQYHIISDRLLVQKLYLGRYTYYEVPRGLLHFRTSGVSHQQKEILLKERKEILQGIFGFVEELDVKVLASLEPLTREDYIAIASKYPGQSIFLRALRAYYQDNRQFDSALLAAEGINWKDIWNLSGLPVVSLILPFYKAEKSIANTLESILAQSFMDFEVICINDQALDNTQAIIDQYVARDKRVRSFVNDNNMGLGATRNRGVSLSQGLYIFHIDPDDTLPEDALRNLVDSATLNNSQLVKGLFARVNKDGNVTDIVYSDIHRKKAINTSLKENPKLLDSTEGHWSILYDSVIAERVSYPTDLKMGQDSFFLTKLFPLAKTVSAVNEIVYNYHTNHDSTMYTFTPRKYFDEVEWRRRARYVLSEYGYQEIGDQLLQAYWYEPFVRRIPELLSIPDQKIFLKKIGLAFAGAGYKTLYKEPGSEYLTQLFTCILNGEYEEALNVLNVGSNSNFVKALQVTDNNQFTTVSTNKANFNEKRDQKIKVLTLSSIDSGGAGIAAKRLAQHLRLRNIDLSCYSVVIKDTASGFKKINCEPYENNWTDLEKLSVVTRDKASGLVAREIFTNTESIVDFKKNIDIFEDADIIHLHWVAGMFDYKNADQVLANKPIVWTLHDMNPFTGGCHYSEGCERFTEDCSNCPLLGGESNLAFENLKIKKDALQKINNLHIVCPSRWLTELAKRSSLFRNRKVTCIENAYDPNVFAFINKTVARTKLGLPFDKQLILFGADSVESPRKGGDLLQRMLISRTDIFDSDDINIILFGSGGLKTTIPTHCMGRVTSDETLSLIYAAADVLVFPSREDNAPMIVGESLLCGTPVVSFPVGSIPDLIVENVNGHMVNFGDIDSMAEAVKSIIKDNNHINTLKRGIRCRQLALSHFDLEKSVADYLNIYDELIKESGEANNKLQSKAVNLFVVTPCLNVEETINETINSVISQSGDFRLIYHVQDGGSVDRTLDILRNWEHKLQANKSLIKCREIVFSWSSEADSGMYHAITKAFDRIAPGENDFLTWINGDDLLLPGALSVVSSISKNLPDVEWIGSQTYNILNNGVLNCSRPNPTPTEVIREGLCDGYHWYHLQQEGSFFTGRLWRKSKHALLNYHLAGDWALWKEFSHHAQYYQVNIPLGAFRIRDGQLSSASRDKYEHEINLSVPKITRDVSYEKLYSQRRSLECLTIQAPNEKNVVGIVVDRVAARNEFFRRAEKLVNHDRITPGNFDNYTYARNGHWETLRKYEHDLYGEAIDPASADLKRYQDLLAYSFIVNNVKPGARILEIGGGNSRIFKKLSSEYECWLVDKLEGVGNGPKHINANNVKLIRDYIGNYNNELPDNYFDFVFSISVLEHVPQNDDDLLMSIIEDTNRILKIGGYSLHLFDVVIKDGLAKEFSKLIRLMFNGMPTCNKYVDIVEADKDGDIFYLNCDTYNRIWRKYTNKTYSEFGSPTSCNVLWMKLPNMYSKGKPPITSVK